MNLPVLLRPYDAVRDLESCLAIWRAASENAHSFLGTDAIRSDEEAVRERYMPLAEITIAEREGEIAGFIALLGSFIGGLFVSPARHRFGIGRELVEDAARRKGVLEVEVYRENSRALAFYRAIGLRAVSERPLDDLGRAHSLVLMQRPATHA